MEVMPVDLAQAASALERNRPAEARPLLESATRAEPRNAMAWALLAQTYQRLGETAQAALAAQRAEAAAAPSADARVQHALALFHAQSGNRKKAAALETRYARSAGADRSAPARAALLNWETGNRAEAIALGTEALRREDRVEIHEMLARAREAAGQPDLAIARWRDVVRLRPYSEEARGELGKALLRFGKFTEAAVFLEQARRDFDKSPQLDLALGVACYSLRRFDDAATLFLRVIDLAPDVEQPYVFLARMIDQIPARVPQILPRFSAWGEVEKANHYAPFVLAKALLASGEESGRVEPLLREAIRRQPRFWESHFELAQLLESRPGGLAPAAEAYRQAAALNPSQAGPHYRLARVYERQGQKALAARERAIHAQLLAAEKGRPGMADENR